MRSIAIIIILLFAQSHAISQCKDGCTRGLEFAMVDYVADSAAIVLGSTGQGLAYQCPMEAIPYLQKAVDYWDKKGNYKQICANYCFMGIAYSQMGDFEKCFEFFNIQRNLCRQNLDTMVTDIYADINSHLAGIYLNRDQLDSAY